jgi:hypothetical protein
MLILKRKKRQKMDIEEGEEVQAKGIEIIFNKIIAKFSQILRRWWARFRWLLAYQIDKITKESVHSIL